MPPLTATADHVKPFVLVPVKGSDVRVRNCITDFCHDSWLEKVFERQEAIKPAERTLKTLTPHPGKDQVIAKRDSYDEHSYKEELQKFIAESTANLHCEDHEPLNSSDEDTSDEDASPRNAQAIDFSPNKAQTYVEPPVEVPRSYRTQDRLGGVLVAGHRVLFTNWAFKREMRHLGHLGPLPERVPVLDEAEDEFMAFYSGKIIEL
ncbi:hypothetical protein PF005_g15350 [Phytophthora fragariae]|uniref:Uncharacterized protein n=1 Tax=Phytophthora fragariae TaxID=53985 RepID=A0A6A3E995_9STRA|nr:hypothetical protein PF003_g2871 [Phytophthora fragariae]KAE8930095.1 hypothetical protein PF009_g19804 [Phytophthora fragariae]KAE8991866.1 hypothetical protein PF011_g17773 [Phytophthora fragariae]KAE9091243.1 hypothetical protein PF007_g18953 [Phytophthora fragariae]KAE9141219.1 hypothetical protein PF006_g13308 [Phytophthora fragariae]